MTGSIPNFEFAEAKAPLSLLPGVNVCGGKAFVQLRTRSSSTANSDLKDTTKIFEFVFAGLSASASKTSADGSALSVTLTGSATGGGRADRFPVAAQERRQLGKHQRRDIEHTGVLQFRHR